MITFTLDARAVSKVIQGLQEGLRDFRPVLKEASTYQLGKVEKQFGSEGAEITGKWKALEAKTISRRLAAGYGAGPILTASGRLRKSIKETKLTAKELNIGSKVAYFKYHQTGTDKMSQRQVLGHSKEMTEKVTDLAHKHLTKAMQNG